MLDAVAAGRKKPVRALGEEALVLATSGEASVVVVGKALCGKGLLQKQLGGASAASACRESCADVVAGPRRQRWTQV